MIDTRDRLRALTPRLIDGEPWWEWARVLEALHVYDHRRAAHVVRPEHKRKTIIQGRDWRFRTIIQLVDRAGVEALVLRYGGRISRAELMEAVDTSVP